MARYRIGLCWTENLLYYGKNGVFFGKSFDYRIVEPAAYDRWMQLKRDFALFTLRKRRWGKIFVFLFLGQRKGRADEF